MALRKDDKDKKLHNKNLGKKGEDKACAYLRLHGWKIIERNFKSPFGEIDIIARKGDVFAFTEVKTRLSDEFGLPSEAVTNNRKQRYILGANYFFNGKEIDCTVRFDIIEILNGKLNHIENAFEA